jgi:hypothetical protein
VVATVVAVVSPALGGEAASPEALVGGLRLGLLARVGFAVVALPIVVWGVPEGKSSGKRAPSRDG